MSNGWFAGKLRVDLGPLPKGQIVFFRRVARPLAAGPCWWIRPQGIDHYWMVAESYGGPRLRDLVLPKRTLNGLNVDGLAISPPDKTQLLEQGLKRFIKTRPPGAIPPPGVHHVQSSSPRRSVNLPRV